MHPVSELTQYSARVSHSRLSCSCSAAVCLFPTIFPGCLAWLASSKFEVPLAASPEPSLRFFASGCAGADGWTYTAVSVMCDALERWNGEVVSRVDSMSFCRSLGMHRKHMHARRPVASYSQYLGVDVLNVYNALPATAHLLREVFKDHLFTLYMHFLPERLQFESKTSRKSVVNTRRR